jgi:hypothetical protein
LTVLALCSVPERGHRVQIDEELILMLDPS